MNTEEKKGLVITLVVLFVLVVLPVVYVVFSTSNDLTTQDVILSGLNESILNKN